MTHIDLRDPEHRRDVLIVIGLMALGIAASVVLGLVFVWLLQSLGWWDALFATAAARHSGTDHLREVASLRQVMGIWPANRD